jgi:hypothetical protein
MDRVLGSAAQPLVVAAARDPEAPTSSRRRDAVPLRVNELVHGYFASVAKRAATSFDASSPPSDRAVRRDLRTQIAVDGHSVRNRRLILASAHASVCRPRVGVDDPLRQRVSVLIHSPGVHSSSRNWAGAGRDMGKRHALPVFAPLSILRRGSGPLRRQPCPLHFPLRSLGGAGRIRSRTFARRFAAPPARPCCAAAWPPSRAR